jgi:hypothetical protein
MKNMALHLLDIIQNSIRASAFTIELTIDQRPDGFAVITLTDDGRGMSEEILAQVTDPFFTSRTTRKVGLGIPLFRQSAMQTGGTLHIQSAEGAGTTVEATFNTRHPDMVPWGDMAGVVVLMVAANPDKEFVYLHRTISGEYRFDTREIKTMLDGVPIQQHEVRRFLREMLSENLNAIEAAGVLKIENWKLKIETSN